MGFSGSYDPRDVTFLLKPVDMPSTPPEEKEILIQSGKLHYSEMISREPPPSPEYERMFLEAQERQGGRFARDLLQLAASIATAREGALVLVSLARAGTPVGVIVARILRALYFREVRHYSISIIRDRGVDNTALEWILARHQETGLVFLDGWTGKGVIARELKKSLQVINRGRKNPLPDELFVVADLAGHADFAATAEDYLMPCAILGGTVSGLVSRSILNREVVGVKDFHACLLLSELAPCDRSRDFADQMTQLALGIGPLPSPLPHSREELTLKSRKFLAEIDQRYGVGDPNLIKPGIAETTRALLRRVPDRILLKDPQDPDLAHLLFLAGKRGIPVEISSWMPYKAASLICRGKG